MTRAPSLGCGNTLLLTVSSVSVSEATKSSLVARDSAMSITIAMVNGEVFLAERRAKTLRRTSHSGWFCFCLAKRGKNLRQTEERMFVIPLTHSGLKLLLTGEDVLVDRQAM